MPTFGYCAIDLYSAMTVDNWPYTIDSAVLPNHCSAELPKLQQKVPVKTSLSKSITNTTSHRHAEHLLHTLTEEGADTQQRVYTS